MAFQLSEMSRRVQALLDEAQATFRTYEKLGLSAEQIPSRDVEGDAVKLVFVGSYSSGKSSIIKMLTGIDTGIDADIKTNQAAVYEWNGIKIVDTPGVKTGIRPDHDAITEEEILHADLLIFVISNEGFNPTIGSYFHELAVDHQRGANIILVVNKMDRAPHGNVKEQQQIMLPDIENAIAPFTAEKLYTSFISAKRYKKAMEQAEGDVKQALWEQSGYETFVGQLNAFVQDKKIGARLQKPLHELEGVIAAAQETAAGQDMGALETLAERKLRILREKREECRGTLQDIAETAKSHIEDYGREASHAVGAGSSPDDAEEAVQRANADMQRCMKECVQNMKQAFEQSMEQAEEAYEKELQKDFAQNLLRVHRQKLDARALAESAAEEQDASLDDAVHRKTMDSAMKQAMASGTALTSTALDAPKMVAQLEKTGAWKEFNTLFSSTLNNYKGSSLHETVKEVGDFFGVKFKPWEASKYTKWMGMVGSVIQIVNLAYAAYKALTDDERARDEEKTFQEARRDIRRNFSEEAANFYKDMCKASERLLHESIDPAIEQLQENLQRIEEEKQERQACHAALVKLDDRTHKVLELLQAGDVSEG